MDRTEHHKELKQRVERLEHDYRVLWTYYHMAQSLLRSLLKVRRLEDLGLDQIYDQLKNLKEQLKSAEDPIPLIRPFQEIEQKIQHAHYLLTQFDSNISPAVLRRFIERLEQYDPRFLVYLIMFILSKYPLTQDDWDKIDLLLTKLCIIQTGPDQFDLRPERDILHIQKTITRYYEVPPITPDRIREVNAEIQAIAAEIRRVTSYSDLLEWGLLARIREFKKGLHHVILHPQVMIPYLRLNLTTKRKFQVLYQQEIDRIHASLREIEDDELHELESLKPSFTDISHVSEKIPFNSSISEDFVVLLSQMASRMEDLAQKLEGMTVLARTPAEMEQQVSRPDLVHSIILSEPDQLAIPEALIDTFESVEEALNRVNWSQNLRQIARSPEVENYRFESFEIEAYQLGFRKPTTNPVERYLYRLMFIAAICRIRMSRLAVELVRRQREQQDRWFQMVSPAEVAQIQTILELGEQYEQQLEEWSNFTELPELMKRRLSRSLRKLQRTRVGLSLLKDQLEDERSLSQEEMAIPSTMPLQVVQVRVQNHTGRFDNLFSWLGWITALAMFILMIILLLAR